MDPFDPPPPGTPTTWGFRVGVAVAAVVLVAAGLGLRLGGSMAPTAAVPATVTVDFGTAVATVDPTDIGATISGYGNGSYVANDEAHQARLRTLGLGLLRIELKFAEAGNPESGVVCNSLGCDAAIPGADWIAGIKAVGAQPLLVLPIDPDHPAETDAADAVALARFFTAQGLPVTNFVVGNEPDLGGNQKKMGVEEYSRRFNLIADALHAADAEAAVGGPTVAGLGAGYVDPFLRASGGKLDFLDFHRYGRCSDDPGVQNYATAVEWARGRIAELVPDRAGEIPIQVGEFNLECDRKEPGSFSHEATLWGAGALGTILRADARAVQFSDKNEGLGLVSEGGAGGFAAGDPHPIYHAIGMFTGEGLFRRFGTTVVEAASGNDALQVFASTGEKNVVVVNTSEETADVELAFEGLGAGEVAADVWQSTADGMAPHAAEGVTLTDGKGSVALPARSVTTLVLAPDAAEPAPGTTTVVPPSSSSSSSTSTTVDTTPSSTTTIAPPPGAGQGSGLRAEYFPRVDLTGPSHVRVEPRVALDYEHAPFADFPVDGFSVRWTGWVRVDALGEYTFTTTSDDGVRLWLDDALLVDQWTEHSIRDDSAPAALTPGWHAVRLEFYDSAEIAFARLSWQGPGFEREVIPTDRLSPAP